MRQEGHILYASVLMGKFAGLPEVSLNHFQPAQGIPSGSIKMGVCNDTHTAECGGWMQVTGIQWHFQAVHTRDRSYWSKAYGTHLPWIDSYAYQKFW